MGRNLTLSVARRAVSAAALLAALTGAAFAQGARYGSPSGCAQNPALGGPYLYYDGARMIASFTCTLTAETTAKVKGNCTGGPQGPFIEEFAVDQTADRVQIKRADGTLLMGLPVCK